MTDQASKPTRKKRPLWFYPCAVAVGLLGALIVAEIGLRVVLYSSLSSTMDDSPENPPKKQSAGVGFGEIAYRTPTSGTIYRLKPNAKGTMHRPLKINSLGFRDDEVAMPKPPKTYRIVFLGDSTMFGWFIERQNGYVEMIEDDLQQAVGRDWKVECINTAVPAYNAAQEVALFHETCLALQPDAVVIQYELNDELIFPYAIEPPFLTGFDIYLRRLPDLWRGKYKTMEDLVMAIQGERLYEKYPGSHGWNSVVTSYRRLAATCREKGLPLIVLMPPFEARVNEPDKTDDARFAPIRGLCRQMGVTPVEIFKTVQAYAIDHDLKYADLIVSAQDNHANERGHALIAQAALPAIERELLPRILGKDNPLAQRAPDSNRALRYTTGHGFYETEDWGDVPVNWTKLKAGTEFDPIGRRMNLTYRVAHNDVSLTSPVTVTVTVSQARPAVERAPEKSGFVETTRGHVWTATFTHTQQGYFTQAIDLADFPPGRLRLEIAVNRAFNTPPDWRHMGVALYPLAFAN